MPANETNVYVMNAETSSKVGGIEVALRLQNVVYVQKTASSTAPNHFTSVRLAVASITTASSSNPFVVLVGPGVFTESQEITLPQYVSIIGSGPWATTLAMNASNKHVIITNRNCQIANVGITGAVGTDMAGVYANYTGTSTLQDRSDVFNCRFMSNDTHILAESTTGNSTIVHATNCIMGGNEPFNKGFTARNVTGTSGARILLRNVSTSGMTATFPTYIAFASGTNSEIVMNNVQCRAPSLIAGTGVQITDGARLRIISANFRNFAKGVHVSTGGAAPILFVNAISNENNTSDLQIDHTGTTGSYFGVTDISKITIASGVGLNVSVAMVDTGTATGLALACLGQSAVRAYASQTADMQQWQSSAAAVLAGVTSAGIVYSTNALRAGATADTTNGNIQYVSSTTPNDMQGRVGGSWLSLVYTNVSELSSTAQVSTTSATFATVATMTQSLTAGTYWIISNLATLVAADSDGEVALFVNGTQNTTATVRTYAEATGVLGATTTAANATTIMKKITIASTQTVDIRYRATAGTITINGRVMFIIPAL